jgi:cytochrome c-type biogenesis protein CcmH/NrfG
MAEISPKLKIAAVSALVILAFGLGYLMGSNRQSAPLETATGISPADMRGAFGNQLPDGMPAPDNGGTFGSQSTMGNQSQAPGLRDLVAGLEKKVAADPQNIDQQLLLARTYEELGERAKGLKLLRTLHQQHAENMDVNFILAALLMQGTDKQELQEAYRLFGEAAHRQPELATMARSHQREIKSKLGESSSAE